MYSLKIDRKDFDNLSDHYQQFFDGANTKRILSLAAAYIDLRIVEKTSKGIDLFGEDFLPYAPLTVFLRGLAGLPTGKPDLFFTGEMFGAMTHSAEPRIAEIFFMPGGGRPTPTEKAMKNNLTRPFFGVTENDANYVKDLISREFDKAVS